MNPTRPARAKRNARGGHAPALALALAALFSLALRVWLLAALPLGDGVGAGGLQGFDDEPSHFAYVQHLLETGRLPVETVPISHPDAYLVQEFEHHQPPLYYLLAAGLCRLANAESPADRLTWARALNLLVFAFAAAAWWRFFRRLGGRRRAGQALLVPLLAGSLVFHFGLCSNDPLSWALLWTAVWLALDRPLDRWLPLTLVLAAAHWTKGSVLAMTPFLVWVAVEDLRREGVSGRTLARAGAILLGPWLLALPWYWRNWALYGELFHLGGADGLLSQSWIDALRAMARTPYGFFHGLYLQPPPPGLRWINLASYLLAGAATLAWIASLPTRLSREPRTRRLAVLAASWIAAWFWLALPTGFVEARLAFPALPVFWWIWLEGAWRLEDRGRLPAVALPAVLLLLLGLPWLLTAL